MKVEGLKRKYVYAVETVESGILDPGNCWSIFIEAKIQGIEEEG